MIGIRFDDGTVTEIPLVVAKKSGFIRDFIETQSGEAPEVRLMGFSPKLAETGFSFVGYHLDHEHTRDYDDQFLERLTVDDRFDVLGFATYMQLPRLQKVCKRGISEKIRECIVHKDWEKRLRETFSIGDLSPEDEARLKQILKEHDQSMTTGSEIDVK